MTQAPVFGAAACSRPVPKSSTLVPAQNLQETPLLLMCSGRVEEPRGWLGSGSRAQGPGAREMWACHRHGRSRCWRSSRATTAAHCEGGEQEQGDIVLAPGPQLYLIAFQPTHELLVTQKFSKFPIISRREET
eukprot:bmy_04585T0